MNYNNIKTDYQFFYLSFFEIMGTVQRYFHTVTLAHTEVKLSKEFTLDQNAT